MKKTIYLLSLVSSLLLVGCKPNKSEGLGLNVAAPKGAPAIALYNHLGNTDEVEIGDATNIQSYFADQSNKDVVIAPTNVGIAAINNGSNFKLAATVTFGNFFLASTGMDEDEELNEGDKILAFQQNGIAGKLLAAVLDLDDYQMSWLADVSAVKSEILTNASNYDYVLLAEPVYTAVHNQNNAIVEYANIQTLYQEKYQNLSIMQASIFVSNSANNNTLKSFLNGIKEDIEALLADPSVLETATADLDSELVTGKIGGAVQLVKNLIKNNNRLGIGFMKAIDNKSAIDTFIGTLGLPATNEEIYFNFD